MHGRAVHEIDHDCIVQASLRLLAHAPSMQPAQGVIQASVASSCTCVRFCSSHARPVLRAATKCLSGPSQHLREHPFQSQGTGNHARVPSVKHVSCQCRFRIPILLGCSPRWFLSRRLRAHRTLPAKELCTSPALQEVRAQPTMSSLPRKSLTRCVLLEIYQLL